MLHSQHINLESSMQRNKSRPDPVSCQSCRSKKLKCNRVQPCSNCTARGIHCQFLIPPSSQTVPKSAVQSTPDILRRIERLESIVLRNPPSEDHSNNAPDDPHGMGSSGLSSGSENVVVPGVCQTRDEESQRDNSLLPSLSHGLAFRISTTREIRASLQSRIALDNYQANGIIVPFPAYTAANLLFRSFESHLDPMCSILHIATVRTLIKTLCLKLSQGEPVPPEQAALLLSIFALSAFFYQPSESSEVAATEQDAVNLSKALCKGALDVLDHSRRNTSGTLEDVQAYIIMSLVIFHLDGFSARGRLMLTTAVSIARDLGLNRLDAEDESPAEDEYSVRASIDREVKRRVFWHITTEDWLQSTTCGPQGGMYFIHPNHVDVRLPKSRFDDEITLGESNELMVEPQPSGMTYFPEKVRLAHLCREIADAVPSVISKLIQVPYDNIIALDKKLEHFISSLPFFFRLDAESRERTKALEAVYPHISIMRYSITHAAHSRRCRLHQRFLLRQSYDPRYAYSRRACLESARAVIQGCGSPGFYDSPTYVTARLGIAMHYTHLALVVMVMDMCFNRDEADEAQMKSEVKAALQSFEDARRFSPVPGRFLRSLCDIMHKHNVYLTEPSSSTCNNVHSAVTEGESDGFSFADADMMQPSQGQPGLGAHDLDVVMDTSFDDFWQFASQSEPNQDSLTWDNLFSALDTRPNIM
ncbi:hypothetical protein F4781DRAFT_236260 [Annulohypoxylon bovei var. microspora]|nr:hypothetical protein F4781DRAFT_236260 [Annulohypoxylon bovei var. microspora]